jgi:hypothetical protein
VALALANDIEAGATRPWIIRRHDGCQMWFCCRGWRNAAGIPEPPYRLGLALSTDGSTWRRQDGLLRLENPAQSGDWDSEMQAYPCVVPHGRKLLLFYNGNGFGQSGFGFARVLA